ncbi:MAG: hypothetical protein AAGC81_13290 [Pseudomonadota bacterium]
MPALGAVHLPDFMLPFNLSEDDARKALAERHAYPETAVYWRGVFLSIYSVSVDGRPGLATAAPEAEAQLPQSGHLRATWMQGKPLKRNDETFFEFDFIAPTLIASEAVEVHQSRLIADSLEVEGSADPARRERQAIMGAAPPSVTDPILIAVPVWVAHVPEQKKLLAVDGSSGAVASSTKTANAGFLARLLGRLSR